LGTVDKADPIRREFRQPGGKMNAARPDGISQVKANQWNSRARRIAWQWQRRRTPNRFGNRAGDRHHQKKPRSRHMPERDAEVLNGDPE